MSKVDLKIETMKLKKSLFGGYDREEVYLFIKEVYALHQEEIAELKEEIAALHDAKTELEEAQTVQNQEIEELKSQILEEQFFHGEYNEKFQTLADAIALVNDNKTYIIENTKRTAADILDQANEQLNRINQECSFQQRRRDAIITKITGATKKFDVSMEKLRSNLYVILGEVDTVWKENAAEKGETQQDDAENNKITGKNEDENAVFSS